MNFDEIIYDHRFSRIIANLQSYNVSSDIIISVSFILCTIEQVSIISSSQIAETHLLILNRLISFSCTCPNVNTQEKYPAETAWEIETSEKLGKEYHVFNCAFT